MVDNIVVMSYMVVRKCVNFYGFLFLAFFSRFPSISSYSSIVRIDWLKCMCFVISAAASLHFEQVRTMCVYECVVVELKYMKNESCKKGRNVNIPLE